MKNQWHIYKEQIESVKSLPSKVEQNLEIAGIIYAAYQKPSRGRLSFEFYT